MEQLERGKEDSDEQPEQDNTKLRPSGPNRRQTQVPQTTTHLLRTCDKHDPPLPQEGGKNRNRASKTKRNGKRQETYQDNSRTEKNQRATEVPRRRAREAKPEKASGKKRQVKGAASRPRKCTRTLTDALGPLRAQRASG